MAIFGFSLYCLFIVAAGLFTRRSRCREREPRLRFAVIVPAHNEEKVIGRVVENLLEIDYPNALYDVYVIADHCSDGTARVARQQGAIVWERAGGKRGKGGSLKEIMVALGFAPGSSPSDFPVSAAALTYDAVVIIDADNLVAPNLLQVMNNRLLAGEKLIQCSIEAKNPDDNWVTSLFTINFWLNNRFMLQARYNLRLSSLTAGTGVCVSREVLAKTGGWATVTITEDLEFAVLALLHGFRATFARETSVYDEKPLTFSAACEQRLRWARGQLNVAALYIFPLLLKGLIQWDPARIEGGLRLMQLPFVAVGVLAALLAAFMPEQATSPFYLVSREHPILIVFFGAVPYLLPLLALLLDRLPFRPYRYFPFYPFFYLSWIALILFALITFRRQKWVPSNHTRDLDHRFILRQMPSAPPMSKNAAARQGHRSGK